MAIRQVGSRSTDMAAEIAVVTGASSGIGKVYADRLAQRGYDLVLIARQSDKLEAVAAELRSKYGIEVKSVVADLSDLQRLETVAQHVADNEGITLLVNNAGITKGGPLADAEWADQEAMIRLNVVALSRLSLAVLHRFKANGRGTIVNIGSAAGFYTTSNTAFYSATKAFVINLTRGLQAECAGTGITIQLVAPAATESGIWEASGLTPPATVMSTEVCVDAALRGLEMGETMTLPSLQDQDLLERSEASASELLRVSRTRGCAAERYSRPAA